MTSALTEAVNALKQATDSITRRLSQTTSEELEAYVEERERYIQSIRSSVGSAAPGEVEALKPTVDDVLAKDAFIVRRMTKLRDEASEKLNQTAQAKTQRTAYEPAQPVDSYFFDRKK
ncbi:flagellar protein FliT [Paenibacillus antri]|uniref:Flagellar protein FliT n=1 Tax=Paenibacillus antri TaxID=2582848 RepID=A0A5R9G2K6_9BACL|nr:flagellar protein FliT [Paenibacillus antri]TLS50587.1 flagellar protein FliT [Paenibacillus antri]